MLESSSTILYYVAKISYQSHNWYGNCQWGDQNCTQTHTHTDTYTHTHTQTHTRTPILYVLVFCENAEARLKQVIFPRISTTGLSSKAATVFSSLQGASPLWLIQRRIAIMMFIHSIGCSIVIYILGRHYVLLRNNITYHRERIGQ